MIIDKIIFKKHLEKEEKILYVVHAHWVGVTKQALEVTFFGLLLPWTLYFMGFSTSLFFSTILRPRRALTLSFAVTIFFYIVGIFWDAFPEAVHGMRFASIFYYFETSNLLVNHVWDNVLLNILILTGYSACMVGLSVLLFNKRDIPV